MVSSVKKEVIYMQVIHKNHMEILWHDYAEAIDDIPITSAGIIEKSSVIGRTGLMLLSCGTGAWRVRQSMNTPVSMERNVTRSPYVLQTQE